MNLFEKHKSTIEEAMKALHDRTFFAHFPEHPGVYGEGADEAGRKKYAAFLGKPFDELQQEAVGEWIGTEESPYTQEKLGISYPSAPTETFVERAKAAAGQWRKASPETRAGILMESLHRFKFRFFENAYATMHTTGQGYMMAFQASGPHAADRALEAMVAGYEELKRFPEAVTWVKPMGKYNISLNKTWQAVPKGVALVIGCSTFPTWNSTPGLYANLITGNPVLVKPHPGAVLPIALVVAEIQHVLKAEGFDPNICQLVVDTHQNPITKTLVEHPDVKIIDYTGNAEFGNYLESLVGKTVFTEKTGVNSIIIDSTDDVDKMIQNISFSILLYSGQMCTAPQNYYIPEGGINTPDGKLSVDEFEEKFLAAMNALIDNPKAGPYVLGAIQNPATCQRVSDAEKMPGKVLAKSRTYENPMFKNARTATPVIVELNSNQVELFSKEVFGPIAFIIKTKNTAESVKLAVELGKKHGAMSCGAYTTDAATKEMIMDEMALAGTPVSFNLTGGIYINQTASFSDFHGTGANPAANASFSDPEYVVRRFNWVGFREPA
jgi:phenylacetic acid degradation protein paaN